jgi:hypothetical protein
MIGKKIDLRGRIWQEMDKQNVTWNFTASSTSSHSEKKTLKFQHVMKVVVWDVNFIRSHGLHHCHFQSFFVRN